MSTSDVKEENLSVGAQPAGSHRGLKIAVITMGVLLVAGFMVVLGTIIYRASHKEQVKAAHSAFEEIALSSDARLVNSQVGPEHLVLTVTEGDLATTILIVDLDTAHLIGALRLAPGETARAALKP